MRNSFPFEIKPILTLSKDKAISTLIKINKLNLLFDCGWNDSFTEEIRYKYQNFISENQPDAIFLSNNSLNYFGALPYIMSLLKSNKKIKIYSTTPISKLGIYIMRDTYIGLLESRKNPFNFEINKETLNKYFFSINDLKFQQNIELSIEPSDEIKLKITPLPSGFTLGGCVWKLNYKFYNFLYAPQFSIEPKFITDSFSYQKLKGINFIITDTLINDQLSIIRTEEEKQFKLIFLDNLDKKKNFFIPCDSVNVTLEMIIKIEKILKEFTSFNREDKPEYKVLVCGSCSNEITDGVNSLIEFLSTDISKQFYSFVDKPFNFQYISCIKNMEEYDKFINSGGGIDTNIPAPKNGIRYIILASFESLNIGMSHNIFPKICSDQNTVMILLKNNFNDGSVINYIINQIFINKQNIVNFEERIVVERKNVEDEEEEEKEIEEKNKEQEKKEENMKKIQIKEKELLKIRHSKLFSEERQFLMFSYDNKERFSDFGIKLPKEELEIIKELNKLRNPTFSSSFEKFKQNENSIKENKFRFEYSLPLSLKIENISIKINCQILFFNFLSDIDSLSKCIILNEINPKDEIIFLGELNNQLPINLKNKFTFLKENENYYKDLSDNILTFKYDSSFLLKGKHLNIDNLNDNLYEFNTGFLKIKRNRNKILSIVACDDYMNEKEIINLNNGKEDDYNFFYKKNDMKLIEIKKKIEEELKEKFFIVNQAIIDKNKSISIKIENNEIIIDGGFDEKYFKIRNFIYQNYISNINDNK